MNDEHIPFMREAIALSRSAIEHGNQPFGAVLVKDGAIILRAENTVFSEHDATNHAESNLVRLAAKYEPDFLSGCTLYTSTEPCVMCAGAIFWSGISRVVYACSAEQLYALLGRSGIDLSSREVFARAVSHPVEVIGPVLEDEALDVHRQYWR
jgi:tRNA(Arg) A34 adenosine deaminase TadA